MKAQNTLFAAIRTTDGRDWIDIQTLAPTSDDATRCAIGINESLPTWAISNPIARIAKISLRELSPLGNKAH